MIQKIQGHWILVEFQNFSRRSKNWKFPYISSFSCLAPNHQTSSIMARPPSQHRKWKMNLTNFHPSAKILFWNNSCLRGDDKLSNQALAQGCCQRRKIKSHLKVIDANPALLPTPNHCTLMVWGDSNIRGEKVSQIATFTW